MPPGKFVVKVKPGTIAVGRSDPRVPSAPTDGRFARAQALLAGVDRTPPEYAVTRSDLPHEAAAKVVYGGKASERLVIVREEALTDSVLRDARIALALVEAGLFGHAGSSSGDEPGEFFVLSDGSLVLPTGHGAPRRIAPIPSGEGAAESRTAAMKNSRRLLKAVRSAPVQTLYGVFLRRAGRLALG